MDAVDELEPEPGPSEEDAVLWWRFRTLVYAGYPSEQATTIATATWVDLRKAERLLLAGCSPEVAESILV